MPYAVPTSCAIAAALMNFEPQEESSKPRAALINVRDSFRCSLRLGLTSVRFNVTVRVRVKVRVRVRARVRLTVGVRIGLRLRIRLSESHYQSI